MIDCLILGDSIAVGLKLHRPDCEMIAKGGISSAMFNITYGSEPKKANTVVISLGTNDWTKMDTRKELLRLRSQVVASKVYWIEPIYSHPDKGKNPVELQRMIFEIAQMYGDYIVGITSTRDGVHPSPAGYADIVQYTK